MRKPSMRSFRGGCDANRTRFFSAGVVFVMEDIAPGAQFKFS